MVGVAVPAVPGMDEAKHARGNWLLADFYIYVDIYGAMHNFSVQAHAVGSWGLLAPWS